MGPEVGRSVVNIHTSLLTLMSCIPHRQRVSANVEALKLISFAAQNSPLLHVVDRNYHIGLATERWPGRVGLGAG